MEISQVKDEIAKGLRAFKAFEKAHEVLGTLENIENEILEKTKLRDALKEETGDLQSMKDAAISFCDQVKQKAAQEAKTLLDAAKDHAEKGLADAKFRADGLLNAAKQDADKHAAISETLSAANTKADSALAASKKELSEIEASLAQHKSDMKKFLNG